jgi:hypothetical protein
MAATRHLDRKPATRVKSSWENSPMGNFRGNVMRTFAASLALLMVVSSAALAENFVSNKFGFSANFPTSVVAGEPQPSETDDTGKYISNVVTIKAEMPGTYTALVTVDMYVKPAKIDASAARAMINVFAAQLDAKVTSSKPGVVDGYKARFFSYESRDKTAAGNGIVVIVGSKKPRVYQVFTMHTPQASAADIAALDAFLKSFQLD